MKSTKIKFIFEFPKFKKELKNIKPLVFFFPFYHFGGGEKVHLDILKSLPDVEHTTFIIHNSDNHFFKEEYEKSTHIFPFFEYKSSKYKAYLKAIAKQINSFDEATVFGCNNLYFYHLIPYLNSNVNIIDLTHAFSYEDPYAPEIISLNVVSHINKRIVLGKKTIEDYKKLYAENRIPEKELGKIQIIRNGIEVLDKYPEKPNNESLKVLFVSRNSHEKRPEFFFEIAKKCLHEKINAEFLLVGDFDKNIPHPKNMKIIGSIKDRNIINELYRCSDILLITSFREGLPMVTLESMAYGVVNICTPVGEIPYTLNREFMNGIVIQDHTVQSYIKKEHKYVKNEQWIPKNFLKKPTADELNTIAKFTDEIKKLDQNRSLLKEMSKNSYEFVKKNFSIELFNKNYRRLILNLE